MRKGREDEEKGCEGMRGCTEVELVDREEAKGCVQVTHGAALREKVEKQSVSPLIFECICVSVCACA